MSFRVVKGQTTKKAEMFNGECVGLHNICCRPYTHIATGFSPIRTHIANEETAMRKESDQNEL